jgi:hypothetical protein
MPNFLAAWFVEKRFIRLKLSEIDLLLSTVNHIKEEWVRGAVHTNTIENYWSLLKRGIIGSFHQVSVKHLDRYLAEFEYRQNNSKEPYLFIKTVARMCGTIPLPMAKLVANPEDAQF